MGVIYYLRKNDLIDFSLQYYSISLLHYIGYYTIDKYQNPYILIFIIFGLVPLFDIILPVDERNPTEAEYKILIKQNRFKIPIYLSVFTEWALYIWAFNQAMTKDYGTAYLIGLFIAQALGEAVAINLSHELNHKQSFISKFVGVTSLIKNLNSHFIIEHNGYHHVWVSTPTDTATSKLNQPITNFIINSMIGSYKHSWGLENKRCLETYGTKYSIKNFMIWSTLACILYPLTGYSYEF